MSDWRSYVCSSDLVIIENFNKRGRGRKPARERIEAILERDYAMVKNGNCDYKLTVAYDPDPDGISLDEEIQSLLSEMFNIAESYNCSMDADIFEVGCHPRKSAARRVVIDCLFSCISRCSPFLLSTFFFFLFLFFFSLSFFFFF